MKGFRRARRHVEIEDGVGMMLAAGRKQIEMSLSPAAFCAVGNAEVRRHPTC